MNDERKNKVRIVFESDNVVLPKQQTNEVKNPKPNLKILFEPSTDVVITTANANANANANSGVPDILQTAVQDFPKKELKILFNVDDAQDPKQDRHKSHKHENVNQKLGKDMKDQQKDKKDQHKDKKDKQKDKKDNKSKIDKKDDEIKEQPDFFHIDHAKWSWVSMIPDSSDSKNSSTTLPSYASTKSSKDISTLPLLLEGEIDDGVLREIVYPVTNGVMLAEEYRKGSDRIPQVDPTGWWASEKYDGIRVLWDGISLWTRAMHQINAPIWFQSRLPPSFSLDGELFIKRDHFNETSGIIRNKVPNPDDWAPMMFMVFDIPHLGLTHPFEKRLEILKEICHRYGEPLSYVNHIKIRSSIHLDNIHNDLMLKGAEGTMIRAPRSYYEAGRSKSLLKVKDQYDAECIVEGWEEGKNRNEGRLGALEVSWEDPVGVWEKYGNEYDTPYHGIFKAGSGLSDVDRVLMKDAPRVFPKGSRVKVAFSQLQKSGKPKHPAYKGKV